MVKTVLTWVIVAMVLALLLLLLFNGGGIRGIVNTARSFPTLKDFILGTASSSPNFELPGQKEMFSNLGVDVVVDETGAAEQSYAPPPQSEIRQESATPVYANMSPYAGKVTLQAANSTDLSPVREYVLLTAASDNTADIDISGWSLQSIVSGKRAYIPLAASPFVLGVVNRVSSALLRPGATATVVSGISPVGVSFRETVCTGYLNQMQSFTPALSNSCPSRERVLAYSAENLARYGSECFDYVQSLPQCDFPRSAPAHLSPSCRAFLAYAFSYNGCVNTFQSNSDFALPSWRMYAGYTKELWGNSHDVIRLLDGQGMVVDSVSY